jgi:hypothetical protein
MINNATQWSVANNTPATSYAGLINQRTLQDDVFYKNVRVRFLNESARYLGADLGDSTIISMSSKNHSDRVAVRE